MQDCTFPGFPTFPVPFRSERKDCLPDDCLVQLLSACKPEPTSGEDARVPGATGRSAQWQFCCAWLWGAILGSEVVPCNKITSSKLTWLDLQVNVTCCSQLLPSN